MSRYEVSNIDVVPRGVKGRLHLRYEDIKILKDNIGSMSEYVMTPSAQFLRTYDQFMLRAVTYAHRDQLNHESHGYQGVGYAFGSLYHSVRAENMGTQISGWHNYSMYTDFTYGLEYNRYGDALDTGRGAGPIPVPKLIQWLRMKIAAGTLKRSVKKTPAALLSFAIAITRKASETTRPAYLPGWTDMKAGSSTERSFNDYYQRNQKYYVGLLSNEVMERLAQVNK